MSLTEQEASDLFRREPDGFIAADVGEIAHRVVGDGPDVLFVHGWPVSGATFRRLLPHLVDHVRCHLVDLPGAGSSRYAADAPLTIENHISSVRRVLDALDLREVVVVGHDSGGLIARHAVAGDPRVKAMALIDTEQSAGLSWRFKSFLAGRKVPGFGAALGWLAGKPALRRNKLVLGDAFHDRSLLDGEFDEFFLRPLHADSEHRAATMRLLKSFDDRHVHELKALHARIEVPVTLVWGEHDAFFPLQWAEAMVGDFSNAHLEVVKGAGLFAHEERPAEVAAAILATAARPGQE